VARLFFTDFASFSRKSSGTRRKWVARAGRALLVLAGFGSQLFSGELIAGTPVAPSAGIGYGVDSTGDGDNVVSSNFCDDGTGHCTLRAAIQAANSHPGVDFIGINLPAGSVINLTRPLPDVVEGVSINGPGAGQLTVRRNTGGNYRIFNVTTTGTVTLSGMTISNGSDVRGAGIMNQGSGTVNVTDVVLRGNVSSGIGGAIQNFSTGTVNVTNSTLDGNSSFYGGGIVNGDNNNVIGTVNITKSTLSDNSAQLAGAIYNQGLGSVNITGSTLNGNSAIATGGIYTNQGMVNITNSTLSGNSATSSGGGVFYNNSGTVTVTNSTISGNSDIGIVTNGGTVNVRSSIIALNMVGATRADVNGAFVTGGFNLIGVKDGSTGFTSLSDQTGTAAAPLDPKLDPAGLQSNGGPTQTIKLLFGSPAIDRGTSNGLTGQLTTDQRGVGFPRTSDNPAIPNAFGGDGSDIGALEVLSGFVGNFSTRLPVGTDDNVLIEGFIVQGPADSTKKIIVRAIGPSLAPFGITDALANPTLEIRDANNATIARNDNWRTTQIGGIITSDQAQEIASSGATPTNDFESAIIANLAPGSYTAVVAGSGRTVGTGVVDAYDLSAASPARLANVATRGLIQPNDKLMIAGFIIQNGPVRAVVRAVGPSLTAFGINNALPDTTLQIKTPDGATVIENDDWQTTQKAELEQTTLQPSHPLEAAVVVTLQPGQYTAQVRGKPETTGIGVVQVYFLQ